MKGELRRVEDLAAVAREAAEEIAARAASAVAARGVFLFALAGGSTPRALYRLLASEEHRRRVPWDRTHVLFGDERHVPPDHPDSNYRMAREALLDHVSPAAVHRIEAERRDAAAAAARYQADLRALSGDAAPPRLDVVLLGLGPDGHTASLFPGSPALAERERWVVAPFVPRLGAHRITVTLPVLDRAAAVLFLVAGAEKADALRRTLAGEPLPAARVSPADGALVWIADRAAAAGLDPRE